MDHFFSAGFLLLFPILLPQCELFHLLCCCKNKSNGRVLSGYIEWNIPKPKSRHSYVSSIIKDKDEIFKTGKQKGQRLFHIRILVSRNHPSAWKIVWALQDIFIFLANSATDFFSIESGAFGINENFIIRKNGFEEFPEIGSNFHKTPLEESLFFRRDDGMIRNRASYIFWHLE